MRRKAVRLLFVVLLILAAVGAAVAWALWPTTLPPPEWVNDYDVTARPPERIAPGTVVGQSAPAGWSHLIIKSLPRIHPAHVKRVIGEVAEKARWMCTAFTADVVPETRGRQTRYHLRAVGIGLGTSVNGQDVIITPETASAHGAKLNLFTREILKRGYTTMELAVVVIHGPTFALVDTPVWYRCGATNRLIRFRQALLVDAPTGRLEVACWALGSEGGCPEPGVAVIIEPNTIDEAELVPDLTKFTLGLPTTDDSFGVEGLPPHRTTFMLPLELRDLATRTKFSPDEARALEAGLRQAIPKP